MATRAALNPAEARRLRLRSLLLAGEGSARDASTVGEVVEWFGAMQAQDLGSGLWSFGARLPDKTRIDVEAALERREALRTWPMRGTVHFVPPRDARWMLDLMGYRALAGATARRAYLGLTQDVADRAVEILGSGLAGGGRLTRSQCLDLLRDKGLDVAGQLGYHLLWYTSQCGVTCIAPNVGSEQTFALLDEWAPDPVELDRDEALATIALRYVRSHGPVAVKDLAGWTGLPLRDVRRGIEVAGDEIEPVDVGEVAMVVAAAATSSSVSAGGSAPEILALSGFDEFVLGYKDRTLLLDDAHKQAVIPGGNGIFQWTVVRDGRVVATWRRKAGRTRVVVDVQPLARIGVRDRTKVERALQRYGTFVGLPVEVRWGG